MRQVSKNLLCGERGGGGMGGAGCALSKSAPVTSISKTVYPIYNTYTKYENELT